ncbi:MAG: hypothetical protein SGI71_06860 [Verrucomicrobiota bacterium]|nr:hypothetical protein [Verrucomicrobiota bacterium]
MNKDHLLHLLISHLASGRIPPEKAIPVLKGITSEGSITSTTGSLLSLWNTLDEVNSPESRALMDEIYRRMIVNAGTYQRMSCQGSPIPEVIIEDLKEFPLSAIPAPWKTRAGTAQLLTRISKTAEHLKYSLKFAELEQVKVRLTQKLQDELQELQDGPSLSSVIPPETIRHTMSGLNQQTASVSGPQLKAILERLIDPKNLTQEHEAFELLYHQFLSSTDSAKKREVVETLCFWPTDAAAPYILKVATNEESQLWASVFLSLRFAPTNIDRWPSVRYWLESYTIKLAEATPQLSHVSPTFLSWAYVIKEQPQLVSDEALFSIALESLPTPSTQLFIQALRSELTPEQIRVVSGLPALPKPPPLPPRIAPVSASPIPELVPPTPKEPQKPAQPTAWETHIQPFLSENWYMVAGILMVILGSSLVAFFTWDKHWLIRFTLVPALLAGFTGGLAAIGSWLERRDASLRTTALLLKSASICLLPINFMAITLLAKDSSIPSKPLILFVTTLVYCGLAFLGLRKWLPSVHEKMSQLLLWPLLFLNALIGLFSIPNLIQPTPVQTQAMWVAVCLYGMLIWCGMSVVRFVKTAIDEKSARERLVPWFFGTTLVITFFQAFFWLHLGLRFTPPAYLYSVLVLIAGALILYSEKKVLECRAPGQLYSSESFLGFAFVILGVLMGLGHPGTRILNFILSGIVLISQSRAQNNSVGHWIGLTLFLLAGCSIGLIPEYQRHTFGWLGLGLALISAAATHLVSRRSDPLTPTLNEFSKVVLFLSVMVAVLTQWFFKSPPPVTALLLTLMTLLFLWQALRDKSQSLVTTSMVLAAIVLAYAGCIDIVGKTFKGNTLAFGVGVLGLMWITLNHIFPFTLFRNVRSRVLMFYGWIAFVALLLRVAFERPDFTEATKIFQLMDVTGPILVAITLVFATWYSRSWMPALTCIAILVVFLPEFRVQLRLAFPFLTWGSGFGSALSAMTLLISVFALRHWNRLSQLTPGDPFLGNKPFPLQRLDHTLFTTPLIAGALYLILKVETWTLLNNYSVTGLPLKTALAILTTGLCWHFLSVYLRENKHAQLIPYLAWAWSGVGLFFVLPKLFPLIHWMDITLIFGLILQVSYWVTRYGTAPRFPWTLNVFTRPILNILTISSVLLSLVFCVSNLAGSNWSNADQIPLLSFLAAQLIWHARRQSYPVFSIVLYFLVWTSIFKLLPRHTRSPSNFLVTFSLPFLFFWEFLNAIMSFFKNAQPRWEGFFRPIILINTCVIVLFSIGMLPGGFLSAHPDLTSIGYFILILGLCSFNQRSPFLLLLTCIYTYLFILDCVENGQNFWSLVPSNSIFYPQNLGFFAFSLSLITLINAFAPKVLKEEIKGGYSLEFLKQRFNSWFFPASALVALLAVGAQLIEIPESNWELMGTYLAAATFTVLAALKPKFGLPSLAVFLFTLANIRLANLEEFFLAQTLESSFYHVTTLGVALSMVIFTGIARLIPRTALFLRQTNLILGGFILGLLSMNFLMSPDLSAISWKRLLTSGCMALLAALYFRDASRHPTSKDAQLAYIHEALFHFGVVITLCCAAFLIPDLRTPATALIALSLPALYFYAKAELGLAQGRDSGARFRDSSSVLCFIILGLYTFRSAFHLVLFPGQPVSLQEYHINSPVVIVLGLIMLRLTGIGATQWVAFYGGLALIVGSYFTLTWVGPWSPFINPVRGGFAALVIAHFWISFAQRPSPALNFFRELIALPEDHWLAMRRSWGRVLIVLVHIPVAWALTEYPARPLLMAPLIAGLASVVLARALAVRSKVCLVIGMFDILIALHADFLVESYIDRKIIIFILLAIWTAVLLLHRKLSSYFSYSKIEALVAGFGILCFAHIIYLRPWTPPALLATAMVVALVLFTPKASRVLTSWSERLVTLIPVFLLTWIAFFAAGEETLGLNHLFSYRSWASSVFTLLITGVGVVFYQEKGALYYHSLTRLRPRLWDHLLIVAESFPLQILKGILIITSPLSIGLFVLHYGTAFESNLFILMLLNAGLIVVGWVYVANRSRSLLAHIAWQVMAFFFVALIRRQLMFSFAQWNYEFDVWIMLAASILLTGSKPLMNKSDRSAKIPFNISLLLLPVMATGWVMWQGLGTDIALIVAGLHSVLFAFLGKNESESPYRIISLSGFVLFIILIFFDKLQLRVLHAYIIPVCIGVLVLLEMFRARVPLAVRQTVQTMSLLAMVISSGYYSFADDRYPALFHMTVILLSLAIMICGSFLRLKTYVLIGFGALVTELLIIGYRGVRMLDQTAQMSAMGVFILLTGATVVAVAVLYKIHRDKVDEQLKSLRAKFGCWE